MKKFGYFTKCQKILKQLSKFPEIVQKAKQHLNDILKSFYLKLKINNVVFKVTFWTFLLNFCSTPIMNHYRGSWLQSWMKEWRKLARKDYPSTQVTVKKEAKTKKPAVSKSQIEVPDGEDNTLFERLNRLFSIEYSKGKK